MNIQTILITSAMILTLSSCAGTNCEWPDVAAYKVKAFYMREVNGSHVADVLISCRTPVIQNRPNVTGMTIGGDKIVVMQEANICRTAAIHEIMHIDSGRRLGGQDTYHAGDIWAREGPLMNKCDKCEPTGIRTCKGKNNDTK